MLVGSTRRLIPHQASPRCLGSIQPAAGAGTIGYWRGGVPEPPRRGLREVQMDASVSLEQCPHTGMPVCGVAVDDDLEVHSLRRLPAELPLFPLHVVEVAAEGLDRGSTMLAIECWQFQIRMLTDKGLRGGHDMRDNSSYWSRRYPGTRLGRRAFLGSSVGLGVDP